MILEDGIAEYLASIAVERGLAAAVERLGVKIYERTRATAIESRRVATDRGSEDSTAGKSTPHSSWSLFSSKQKKLFPTW